MNRPYLGTDVSLESVVIFPANSFVTVWLYNSLNGRRRVSESLLYQMRSNEDIDPEPLSHVLQDPSLKMLDVFRSRTGKKFHLHISEAQSRSTGLGALRASNVQVKGRCHVIFHICNHCMIIVDMTHQDFLETNPNNLTTKARQLQCSTDASVNKYGKFSTSSVDQKGASQ